MQCESASILAKFEREKRAWENLYHRHDYPALGIQWRRDDGVELCRRHIRPGGRILDLGCGCGHASLVLARAGYHLHGIDFSAGMIEQACRNAAEAGLESSCRFEVRDALAGDLPGPYDGLIGLGFVEYFDDARALLQHLHSMLTPGGVAVLQIWNRHPWADDLFIPLHRGLARLRGLLSAATEGQPTSTPPAEDVSHRRYTPREFHRLADDSGFELRDARGSLFFPHRFFIAEARRARWDLHLRHLGRRLPALRRRAVNYLVALEAR